MADLPCRPKGWARKLPSRHLPSHLSSCPPPALQHDRNRRPRKSKCVNHLKHFFSGAARCCASSRQGRGMRQISNTAAIHSAPLQNNCAIPTARAKKSYRPGTIPAIRTSGLVPQGRRALRQGRRVHRPQDRQRMGAHSVCGFQGGVHQVFHDSALRENGAP